MSERLYKKVIGECWQCPNCTGLPPYLPKCLCARIPFKGMDNWIVLREIETYPDIPDWCPLLEIVGGGVNAE